MKNILIFDFYAKEIVLLLLLYYVCSQVETSYFFVFSLCWIISYIIYFPSLKFISSRQDNKQVVASILINYLILYLYSLFAVFSADHMTYFLLVLTHKF